MEAPEVAGKGWNVGILGCKGDGGGCSLSLGLFWLMWLQALELWMGCWAGREHCSHHGEEHGGTQASPTKDPASAAGWEMSTWGWMRHQGLGQGQM